MKKRLAGLGLAFCLLASPTWAAPDPVVRMSVAQCDPNNPTHCGAPYYYSAVSITVAVTTVQPTKGVAADCTAGGTITLTMADGSSLSWTVVPGHQNQPYSITGASASTATCSLYGLN